MITCKFENGHQNSLRHVVVDVLVIKDKQILLVQRSPEMSLEPGKWALPGGYVERDETIAEAAAREVLEETGYQIKIIKLLQVIDNPNRPKEDRQNVSFVYLAKTIKKVANPDWEISQTQWFDLDKLPPKKQIAFDHYDNIKFYLENK